MSKILTRIKKVIYFFTFGQRFKAFHISSKIIKPIIVTPKFIKIGKFVQVYHHCRLQGISKNKNFQPLIELGNYVTIQQNLHMTCANSIKIGENTAIAANVTITDINHPYADILVPVEKQPWVITPVVINEDCKIYNNTVILPGTKLGKHCVVGANSVVSGIFPDYSIIVGSPAKIIKRYNFETEKWQKTNPKGEFIYE